MEITVITAGMTKDEENGYVGYVHFNVKGHKEEYELVLQSKKGRDWGYSLNFLKESGPEAQIDEVDAYLDEDDEAFDRLVQAAMDKLE